MQGIVYNSLLIFLTGMLGIWKAVPVGFALGATPVLTFLMTSMGAISSAIILYFFGNQVREYLKKRRKKERSGKKNARAIYLFEKYGTAGLGVLGCLLMGPNMTMLIGLVIVKSPLKLLYWTIGGILVWTLALTLTAWLSIDLFLRLTA